MKWGVVVAAGGYADPELASAIGTSRKALASISGRTSLEYTLSAVSAAGFSECVTVGGEEIRPFVEHGEFALEGETAVDNVLIGIERLQGVEAVLLLPSDSPLMTGEMLAHFVEKVSSRADGDRWFSAGLASASDFAAAFPSVENQSIKLRKERYVSGALYATTPAGLQQAAHIFREARRSRKNQFKLVLQFGVGSVIKYFARQIDLPGAEQALSRGLGGPALLIPDCHPATCMDFDTAEEFEAIRRHLESQGA